MATKGRERARRGRRLETKMTAGWRSVITSVHFAVWDAYRRAARARKWREIRGKRRVWHRAKMLCRVALRGWRSVTAERALMARCVLCASGGMRESAGIPVGMWGAWVGAMRDGKRRKEAISCHILWEREGRWFRAWKGGAERRRREAAREMRAVASAVG